MPNTNANAYEGIPTYTKNTIYKYNYKPTYTSKCRCRHKRICICIYTDKNKPRPTPTNRPESLAATGAPACWAPAPQRKQTQAISQGFSTFSTELSTKPSRTVSPSDFLANVHRTFSENLEDFSKKGLHFQPIVLSYYQQVGTQHCRVLKIQEKEVLQYETVSFAGSRRGQAGRG